MRNLWLIGSILLLFFLASCQSKNLAPTLEHQVTFEHRASKTGGPITANLIEILPSKNQDSSSFYMDVESVFCGEGVCKVDTVRMFWDTLGFYQRIELQAGIKLEKGQAEDFDAQDYIKLNHVLKNKQSGLAHLYKEELVKNNSGGSTVDALSGATVILHKDDFVKDAIWTSYTLWHFANGEVPSLIRNIVGNKLTLDALHARLTHSDAQQQNFALEQLIRRKAVDATTINSVLLAALRPTHQIYDLLGQYLKLLPLTSYFELASNALSLNDEALSLVTLSSLSTTSFIASEQANDTLAESLAQLQHYQHISLLLSYFEAQPNLSHYVIEQIAQLLQHEKFTIARGAYWFLADSKLPSKIKQDLNKFEQQHTDKL